MAPVALVRPLTAAIARCELTHLARTPIDVARAARQHAAYVAALAAAGFTVTALPPLPQHPDAVFVEDTTIVLDELAVITRPGAASRRGETASVAAALGRWRTLRRITAPGTLDGGDVLALGRTLHVGASSRSNTAGREQLRALVAPHGWEVRAVPLRGCLHLKSAVTRAGADLLVINPERVDPMHFPAWRHVFVAPGEADAANVVWLGERTLVGAAFPRTAARLEAAGVAVTQVAMDETAKAEGALSCCSILLRA